VPSVPSALVTAALLATQTHSHATPPRAPTLLDIATRPVALRTGIGSAHDRVSTASTEAQAFYDQGLAYLHSYVWLEAARSFNQAIRLDPALGAAYAQLSLAYAELNAGDAAREALARARALTSAAAGHDRRHVELRAMQMDAEAAGRGDPARLQAYRTALDRAIAEFPDDEELWLLRGLAASADPAERGQGSPEDAIRFYSKAAALAPAHFAAHHYLTHAYENTGRTTQALAEGATYAKMAPGVPHARHMHGHDLRRAGRVADAIVEFEAADALETAYLTRERVPIEYDWHYQHNLDLLAAAYQYAGRMAKAEALFRRSFGIRSDSVEQEINKREWPAFLLARGRAKEALDAASLMAAHRSPVVSAAGHVMAGEARLALGEPRAAADEANAALRLMRGAEGGGLVAGALRQLQGEFLLRTGQRDQGRSMLEDAAQKARAAVGPDAWAQALFMLESMARAAREAGDWDLAARMAQQMVEHDPSYAGGHYALALVADHGQNRATAVAEFDLAARYWKGADPELPELRIAKNDDGKRKDR
jgi:tetratricopeptide (TPR) repeat protein